MNRLTPLLFIALFLTGAAQAQQPGSTSATPPHNPSVGTPPPGDVQLPQITPAEWQQLRAARASSLRTNPDLTAQNQKLAERMAALEAKVEAAMIKNDPTLAPIIAKLAAARHRPGMPASPPPVSPATAPPPSAK